MMTMTAVAAFALATEAQAQEFSTGKLSAEEQAAYQKGDVIEIYHTDKPSGHQIGKIRPEGKTIQLTVLIVNFGREDAAAARAEGRSMATFKYTPAAAEQFLFAEGWDKYHDRFFTRAYVQEGLSAYEKAK
jgi:hypothetical protein